MIRWWGKKRNKTKFEWLVYSFLSEPVKGGKVQKRFNAEVKTRNGEKRILDCKLAE